MSNDMLADGKQIVNEVYHGAWSPASLWDMPI